MKTSIILSRIAPDCLCDRFAIGVLDGNGFTPFTDEQFSDFVSSFDFLGSLVHGPDSILTNRYIYHRNVALILSLLRSDIDVDVDIDFSNNTLIATFNYNH